MKSMKQRKVTRRSFLETALKGGALAGTASLTITKDLFAQASGPIVIGHHCDLTGVISSWGYWHDKCAKAAVDIINKGGGIAGRKVELATEDTESNPAPGARKLRNLIQRGNAEFIVGSVHSGVMLAALPIATELKTPYFSTGEATEVTGSKGTRFSFRTGTDTYSIAAASMPWCVENLGKVWTDHLRRLRLGPEHEPGNPSCSSRRPAASVLASIPVPLDTKDFVPYVAQIPKDSQVVLPAFIGSLSVAFYTQAKAMGLDKQMKMFSSSASLEVDRSGRHPGRGRGRLLLRELPAHARAQERRVPQGVQPAHRHRRRVLPRDRRHPRDGQEPRLAMLGGHLRHQGRDREVRLQDPQGHRGRDPGSSQRRPCSIWNEACSSPAHRRTRPMEGRTGRFSEIAAVATSCSRPGHNFSFLAMRFFRMGNSTWRGEGKE